MIDMLPHALQYAGRGWTIFPVPPNSKKSYKSAKYSGGRNWGATTDPKEISRDFRRWKNAGIGIVMGEKSGVFVVEADTKKGHGKDGVAALEALQKKHGKFPKTLMGGSPTGSLHHYFNYPKDGTVIGNSVSKIADGVDVCGEGGMVVAPPTQRKDGVYKWLNDYPIADAPEWLIDLCKSTPPGNGHDKDNPFLNVHMPVDKAEIAAALEAIPNDDVDWEQYNKIGMACFAAFNGSDVGCAAFHKWAKKSKKYDAKDTDEKWEKYHRTPPKRISVGTLFHLAGKADPNWRKPLLPEGTVIADFVAYMPMHNYIFMPTREPWPASSVDSQLGKSAHKWLDRNNHVEQMLWAPGLPPIIENRLMNEGGWVEKQGVRSLNLYLPPVIVHGNPNKVQPWLNHIRKIYPKDHEHILKWLAHRVQHPEDKINHALVLGGAQGIGKDTILAPVKHAVGPWNFSDITPKEILGRFNEFIKATILRISEARDLGEINRYQFYEHTKVYTAAPPEVLRCDGKNLREHAVLNVCGTIITTNYKTNGIYLPADDRRHYVAWSTFEKEDFSKDYWNKLWRWYKAEGDRNIAAFLAQLDISDFDSKAPPPKTEAFLAIVDASQAPEDSELADILDRMGNPDAVTTDMIAQEATKPPAYDTDFYNWIIDRKNRRLIPHRMETAGYAPMRNQFSKQGLWVIKGKRQIIYVKQSLTLKDQARAAQKLTQ